MANTENPFEHLSLNSLLLLGIETHTDLLAQQSVLEGAAKALAQRAVNADAMVVTNEPVPKAVEDIIAEPEPVDQIASVAVANSVSPSEPSPVQAASSRRRNNGGPSLKLVLSPTSSHDEKPTVTPKIMKSRLLEPTASAPEHDDDPRSESEVRMDFLILKRRVDDHVRSKARRNAYGYEDEVREYLDGIGKYPLLTKSEEVTLAKMIGLGTQSAALMAESGAGLNGFDEKQRRAALKRLAEAKQAKDIFIECNLRLVVSIAGNYKWSEMHLLDLVHAGNDGLNRAVEKFDARRGFKFSTYATWWIKQSIIREIESQVSPVRLPAHMMSRAASARKIMKEYTDAHGGITPTIDELAKLSGRSAEEIQEALTQHRRVHNIVPLDGPIGEDGETTLGDIIVSTDTPETDVMITNMASKAAVDEALRALNEREAQIISLRYLETEEPLTQAEVGARLGLKAEMVRRIERMAILKMRELLNPQRGEATYS